MFYKLSIAAVAAVAAISVQSAQAGYLSGAPIVVDVGSTGSQPATGTTATGSISYNSSWVNTINDLVERDGTVATGTSFSVFAGGQPAGFYLNSAGAGLVLAGEAADIFPSDPAHNFFGSFEGPLGFNFGGLDASTLYNVDVYMGQLPGNAGEGVGNYNANGVTGTLDSSNNTSNVLHLMNVATDSGGNILVQVSNGGIAALQLSVVTPEPASLSLLGLGGLLLGRRRRA